MKYRSRTEIVSNILEAASGSASKTKIMYKAFLSYAQLKEYLAILIEKELLAHDVANSTYKTTPKGLKFLETTQKLDGLLEVRP